MPLETNRRLNCLRTAKSILDLNMYVFSNKLIFICLMLSCHKVVLSLLSGIFISDGSPIKHVGLQ